jgi:hypothetical protein
MSTEAPVHYNIVVPDNVKGSKKNIITLHSKILTLTDTFTVIYAFLYKITFSLGMPAMVNRSPYFKTKAYHMVCSNGYTYNWNSISGMC